MHDGREFESLVEQVLASLVSTPASSVTRDVRLPSPDGDRQIDIAIESTVGPLRILTIVECKDYGRTVSVSAVDALHSVMLDVNANKAVLVARHGFSKGARRKAKRLGVDLFTADEARNVGHSAVSVPVHVCEFTATASELQGDFRVLRPIENGRQLTLGEMMNLGTDDELIDRIFVALQEAAAQVEASGESLVEQSIDIEPHIVSDAEGPLLDVSDLEVRVAVGVRHFFGYLASVPDVLYLHNVMEESAHLVVPADRLLLDYEDNFQQYDGLDLLPAHPLISISACQRPTGFDGLTWTWKAIPPE